MKVAIMQPYIFPYLGYFQLIQSANKFLLLDDVAYINKGWINRNRILVNGQDIFFVVPLEGASQNKLINALTLVPDIKWKNKLEKTIELAYKKSIGFDTFFPLFKEILYFESNQLSEYLANSIISISNFLDIKTNIVFSTSVYENAQLKGQERIIDLCIKASAETYINASGGKLLYDKQSFEDSGIQLKFLQAQLIPYKQIGTTNFFPGLSIIDVLMNNPKGTVQEKLNNFILE
ncbi:MAG: hypothetical protein EOP53_03225 [Sphingobacteriales bacterium]|nr:MAG: hypothetical protein EOP53_03225 [Sphingobacteriales bacterium]